MNLILKEIRSTKSWVKLPKNTKLFQEHESAYESIASLEPANHEFESYTRATRYQEHKPIVIDKVFEPSTKSNSPSSIKTSSSLKHSTLNSRQDSDLYENRLHSKILDKLGKSSIESPANIPILCVCSFSLNDPKWIQLNNRFSSCGINVRLIELQKGVPVNALFYLSNLDLIYVKTADDLEGYVPRDCCKPISGNDTASISSSNTNSKQLYHHDNSEFNFKPIQANRDTDTLNTNSNNYSNDKSSGNDSIKYHSLSMESEYDDLIETNEEFNNLKLQKTRILNQQFEQQKHPEYSIYKYRDSGYRSDNTNYRVLDDYEENSIVSPEKNAKTENKCLLGMQSRSRLPISIRSNLNLTLMDDQTNKQNQFEPNVYSNITYKSPFLNNINLRLSARNMSPKVSKKSEFQRNTTRRSLDSSIANGGDSTSRLQSFYAVSIELDENKTSKVININKTPDSVNQNQNMLYPDLDLNKIELDSLNEARAEKIKENKIWTIILKHEARTLQEINVTPGMLVLVIKEFEEYLYVKLIGYENSNLSLSQQFGVIPRSCAVDLQEIIYNSNKSLNQIEQFKRRKSQITAL